MHISGDPLWLSGKVMEWENKKNHKIPGSLPSPWNLFKKNMHIKSIKYVQQHCYDFPKKPYTMAGFEPGPSVQEADAMSTAPRRQGFEIFFSPRSV
jgi:hypothetical protein